MAAHTVDANSRHIHEEDQSFGYPTPDLRRRRPLTDRMTIGEFAREAGVTLRALRFYQSKGLLAPDRAGHARVYGQVDRDQLAAVLQGKRLGFTLSEIRHMLTAGARGCEKSLPISRKKCIEQIKLLERQRRDVELALAELRQLYTGLFKAILNANVAVEPAS